MSLHYAKVPVRCCISKTSLQEAFKLNLQPSLTYTLHVGEKSYFAGKDAAASAMEEGNPFSPYINLKIDPELNDHEWFLEDEHGNRAGSEGI